MQRVFLKLHKSLLVLLFALMSISFFSQSAGISPFVVGGSDALIEKVPWQAAVVADDKFCGGVVIDPYWVLTAAHCLDDAQGNEPFSFVPVSSVSVYTGIAKIGGPDFEEHKTAIEYMYAYDMYDKNTFNGDIALIKLANPINKNAAPVTLANEEDQLGVDGTAGNGLKDLTLSGWGLIDADRLQYTLNLQSVQISTIADSTCANAWGSTVTGVPNYANKFFCAQAPGKGACNGDSGGPLVWRNPSRASDDDGGARLVGLVSFGVNTQCALDSVPDVYTQISNYTSWIESCMEGTCITPLASAHASSGGGSAFIILFFGVIILVCRRFKQKIRL